MLCALLKKLNQVQESFAVNAFAENQPILGSCKRMKREMTWWLYIELKFTLFYM
jgi:hypothetical protein